MTLSEHLTKITTELVKNADTLNVPEYEIRFVNIGDMPETAPCILIYPSVKPNSVNLQKMSNIAIMTIFCCTAALDHTTAMIESLEFGEVILRLLNEAHLLPPQVSLESDQIYSNIAVSVIEYDFKYTFKAQNEQN